MRGEASSALTLRSSSERPSSSTNCLGRSVPRRVPCPPAATTATTCIATRNYMTMRRVCRPPANWVRRWAVASSTAVNRAGEVSAGAKTTASTDVVALGDHRACRVRRRVAKRSGLVRQRQSIGDVDDILPDPGIAFAGMPPPQCHGWPEGGDVVQPVGQLELERAPVADIHEGVDTWQPVALAHAAQQRLRRRTRFGGVEADAAVHGPHRLAFLGRMGTHRSLGRRQRRVEQRLGRDVGDLLDDERPEPDDGSQPGRYDDVHAIRPCRPSSASRSCR